MQRTTAHSLDVTIETDKKNKEKLLLHDSTAESTSLSVRKSHCSATASDIETSPSSTEKNSGFSPLAGKTASSDNCQWEKHPQSDLTHAVGDRQQDTFCTPTPSFGPLEYDPKNATAAIATKKDWHTKFDARRTCPCQGWQVGSCSLLRLVACHLHDIPWYRVSGRCHRHPPSRCRSEKPHTVTMTRYSYSKTRIQTDDAKQSNVAIVQWLSNLSSAWNILEQANEQICKVKMGKLKWVKISQNTRS